MERRKRKSLTPGDILMWLPLIEEAIRIFGEYLKANGVSSIEAHKLNGIRFHAAPMVKLLYPMGRNRLFLINTLEDGEEDV